VHGVGHVEHDEGGVEAVQHLVSHGENRSSD
jgi:hypothetical protein